MLFRSAEGAEESGSQSYVPPDEKDDRALKEALDLARAKKPTLLSHSPLAGDIR